MIDGHVARAISRLFMLDRRYERQSGRDSRLSMETQIVPRWTTPGLHCGHLASHFHQTYVPSSSRIFECQDWQCYCHSQAEAANRIGKQSCVQILETALKTVPSLQVYI